MDKSNNKRRKNWNPNFKNNFFKNSHGATSVSTSRNVKKIPVNSSGEFMDNWNLYLPQEKYDEHGHLLGKFKVVEEYLSNVTYSTLMTIYKRRFFNVDVSNILKDKLFQFQWSDFMTDLTNSPQCVIGIFGLAMECLLQKHNVKDTEECSSDEPVCPLLKLNPRFTGVRNFLHFQELKVHNYGKFVTLIGTIVRVSDVKPFCTHIAFTCVKCQTLQVIIQENGYFTPPDHCTATNCFCRTFKPQLNSPLTQTVPLKNVRLQELNIDQNEGGRVPRTVECELICDLADSCMPGDIVIISGILTVNKGNETKTSLGKDPCTYTLNLSANSVTCMKGKSVDRIDIEPNGQEFKLEDLNAIQDIHSKSNLFRLVVASLCPTIYGHELIKAGLVLSLFGGRDRFHKQDRKLEFSIRENSHILVVGDPGLGKSQMLLACSNVSPRGVYVCGNSTTTSGLTVTITKDGGGENSLEAGALVLADQGHCCIDEFDKMTSQHSALLEAMEQQTISMAKSGVVCTLPARTSIIAAANPSGGHYNRAKTVSENLRIGGSLLSRFDLVFIVQDRPDQELDSKMSDHVMAQHTEKTGLCDRVRPINQYFANLPVSDDLCNKNNLLRKLQLLPNEKLNFISHEMLQKYISYARKFAQPKLTPEVCKILQRFYLEMRKQHKLNCSIPITTRQLESLIRLTEARARIELRAFCSTDDAEEVIEIMKYSMSDTYSDEFGNIDFDRAIHGSGMSKSSQAKKLINALTKAANFRGDDCFTLQEIKQIAKTSNLSPNSFHAIIDSLNDQGFLLKKGYQFYQIQTV